MQNAIISVSNSHEYAAQIVFYKHIKQCMCAYIYIHIQYIYIEYISNICCTIAADPNVRPFEKNKRNPGSSSRPWALPGDVFDVVFKHHEKHKTHS